MLNREMLIEIAKDTLETVKDGEYSYNSKTIKLNEPRSGILYPESYFDKNPIIPSRNTKHIPAFIVENKPVVDRILEEKNHTVCVLNFASAKHPGGGFLNGAMAQEESMAYCSDLYYTLYNTRLYDLNKNAKSIYYTDDMVLSDVTFFKDSQYRIVENPKTVKVITSPAVNMNLIPEDRESMEKAKTVMKNRMRKVLQVAIDAKCKTIVLGAFGCGVFKNKHEDISKYWHDLLVGENYQIYFDNIYFTIFDRNPANVKLYQRYLRK